jgi:hypothetical protein
MRDSSHSQKPRGSRGSKFIAACVIIAGQTWLSSTLELNPVWLFPVLSAALLIGSVAVYRSDLDEPSRLMRWFARGVVGMLALGDMAYLVMLGRTVFVRSDLAPHELFLAGVVLWVANDPGTDEGGEESARDFTVAVDCKACHMGAGAAIADKGSVDQIPSVPTAEGGLGSVCTACHNGWHMSGKNADGELTAPHTSVQTDMLYGVNTVDPRVESTATQGDPQSPHLKVKDKVGGQRVRESHTVRGSLEEATAKRAALVSERSRGEYVGRSAQRLDDYLESWLIWKRSQVSERTWGRYGSLLRTSLIPTLGMVRLRDLTPQHLDEFYARSLVPRVRWRLRV